MMSPLSILSVLRSSFDLHLHLHHLRLLLRPTSLMIVMSLAVQWTVRFAGASCNAVQSSSCLQAVSASGGSLDHLPGAGHCIVKPYFRYTHVCTLTNYQPSTDYCCCTFEARLLCCRYHQGWYHFRCMEADDELEISVPSVSYTTDSMEDLPLLTLVPVILCPLVAVAICIICITKCWCYRHDNDSSSSSSSSSSPEFCCRCYKIVDDNNEKLPRERFAADEDDVTSPLQHPPPSPSAPPEVPPGSTSCQRSALHPCDPPSFHHADVLLSPFYRRCDGPLGPTPVDPRCFLRGHHPPPQTAPLLCRHHLHGYPMTEDFPGVVHPPRCHHHDPRSSSSSSSLRGFCHRSLRCACAAPLSSAEERRHCDVVCSTAANEQTTEACADCLPPAYESIQAESSAQL